MRPRGEPTESITVRMPKDLLTWLRRKAALEIIERDRSVSINSIIVRVLRREMEAEKR